MQTIGNMNALSASSTANMTSQQLKEATDKTARSIFVGNIPYEATEEKLTELFSKAGPVIGFRLVYDRESGKPKGYGFCEYSDPATAASALRNLQNIEFNGRPLRIGPAAGEQNSAEIALSNPTIGPPMESAYGDRVESKEAPEAISRAVASLPPEQMYELMKQMKLCIQNNPNEARNMLLQNPQLAYALLQAQIVMKIVDPKVAIAMLNRSNEQIPPVMPEPTPAPSIAPVMAPQSSAPMHQNMPPQHYQNMPMSSAAAGPFRQGPPVMAHPGGPMGGPRGGPPSFRGPAPQQHYDQGGPNWGSGPGPSRPLGPGAGGPPNSYNGGNAPTSNSVSGIKPPPSSSSLSQQAHAMSRNSDVLPGRGEQEKAALIMQVLQLSDEQIALLPSDQRRSIMILKEQLAKSNNS